MNDYINVKFFKRARFSTVFSSLKISTGKYVAVKIMPNQGETTRILKLVKDSKQYHHENVLTINSVRKVCLNEKWRSMVMVDKTHVNVIVLEMDLCEGNLNFTQ